MWPLSEHENHHSDNEYDIHMSFKNYETNDNEHGLRIVNHLALIAWFNFIRMDAK